MYTYKIYFIDDNNKYTFDSVATNATQKTVYLGFSVTVSSLAEYKPCTVLFMMQ